MQRTNKSASRKQSILSSKATSHAEGNKSVMRVPPGDYEPPPAEGAGDMEDLLSQYLPENTSKGKTKLKMCLKKYYCKICTLIKLC